MEYAAVGCNEPRVGKIWDFWRLQYSLKEMIFVPKSIYVKQSRRLSTRVWIVESENDTYLYYCTMLDDDGNPGRGKKIVNLWDEKILIALTTNMPGMESPITIKVITGEGRKEFQEMEICPQGVAMVNEARNLFFIEGAAWNYIVLAVRE